MTKTPHSAENDKGFAGLVNETLIAFLAMMFWHPVFELGMRASSKCFVGLHRVFMLSIALLSQA